MEERPPPPPRTSPADGARALAGPRDAHYKDLLSTVMGAASSEVLPSEALE